MKDRVIEPRLMITLSATARSLLVSGVDNGVWVHVGDMTRRARMGASYLIIDGTRPMRLIMFEGMLEARGHGE
jgi:hypothetical protein